jgi:D-alanyl-D-alanine carboxypeptidase
MRLPKKTSFTFFVAWALLLGTNACKESIEQLVAPCTLSVATNNPTNPKTAAYQALLDKYVRKGLPGLILLVKTPEGVWIGSAGKARIETGEPMLPCHLIYSQSIAKTYTAVSIMKLVEEGKINLDATMNTYLPAAICDRIANGKQITVRQLLNHTSGIRNYVREEKFLLDAFNNGLTGFTPQKFLEYIYDRPALFEPGTDYRYSDTNYLLLALMIDYVTGASHADFFTERIFKPLALNDTYYKNEPGYPTPRGYPNTYFDRFANGELENLTDVQTKSVGTSIGDDGILASAYDYAQFVEALVKGKLVSPASLAAMTTWVTKKNEPNKPQYGLGLYYRDTPYGIAIGHDGDGLGAASDMFYFPDSDVTIVMGTNVGTLYETPTERLYNWDLWEEVVKTVFEE